MNSVLYIGEWGTLEAVEALSGQYELKTVDNLAAARRAYCCDGPDVVIIHAPMGSILGQEALETLSMRPLLILTDRRDLWDAPAAPGMHVRPVTITSDMLALAIRQSIRTVRRYQQAS